MAIRWYPGVLFRAASRPRQYAAGSWLAAQVCTLSTRSPPGSQKHTPAAEEVAVQPLGTAIWNPAASWYQTQPGGTWLAGADGGALAEVTGTGPAGAMQGE